jgi:septal ring factor EnvC (AmiA/AmiB activator)
MNDEQFTKLFKYIEEFRLDTERRLELTASQSSLDSLQRTIDKFIGRLDEQELELRARDNQFDKLLEWARKVSEKTGIPLENL